MLYQIRLNRPGWTGGGMEEENSLRHSFSPFLPPFHPPNPPSCTRIWYYAFCSIFSSLTVAASVSLASPKSICVWGAKKSSFWMPA